MINGQIVKIISNLFTVKVDKELYECRARGKFRNDNISPIVGDNVVIDKENKYILEIKERKNELKRPIISNVDCALIITSVKKPELSLNLLDKLLINITFNNIEPIICFTKLDLLLPKEKKYIKKIIKYYRSIGIKVVTNKQKHKIMNLLKNKIVVLTGQTGAGKSTLLNSLNKDLHLATSPISESLGRGKHTTRHVELYNIGKCYFADTPGFSALDFEDMDEMQLRDCFIEFSKYPCDFKDCLHHNEKNCNVKKAVEKGKILESRYNNYIKFLGELLIR